MNNYYRTGTLAIVFIFLLIGCAGRQLNPDCRQTLDSWLETEAYGYIINQLKTNTFMKGLPFIIVDAKGENVSKNIDGLTRSIRKQMVDRMLSHPGINLVRRHPVTKFDRPYALGDVKCGTSMKYKMMLFIDAEQTGSSSDNCVYLSFKAVDVDSDKYIKGFSKYNKSLVLNARQADLFNQSTTDEYLVGTKHIPFKLSAKDSIGAYLAKNLTCIFREVWDGGDLRIYVDGSQTRSWEKDIVWFTKRQLNRCKEIQIVRERSKANYIIEMESRKTGKKGHYQFWIQTYKEEDQVYVKGAVADTYYVVDYVIDNPVIGKWQIYEKGSKPYIVGAINITETKRDNYLADFTSNSTNGPRKNGIIFHMDNNRISWGFYTKAPTPKTFDAKGTYDIKDDKMTFNVTVFPPEENKVWELRRAN